MFTRNDYDRLHDLVFRKDWPGFKPDTVESPNGDGAWDDSKRYAHVAPKYFEAAGGRSRFLVRELEPFYRKALLESSRVCRELGVPPEFMPGPDSTMRVLYYPPGAGSAEHTDFDLLTLSLFREPAEGFEYLIDGGCDEAQNTMRGETVSKGLHFGELYNEITGYPHLANRHRVNALDVAQRSIVFFVMPPHEAKLPSGLTVGEWTAERYARSRKASAQ